MRPSKQGEGGLGRAQLPQRHKQHFVIKILQHPQEIHHEWSKVIAKIVQNQRWKRFGQFPVSELWHRSPLCVDATRAPVLCARSALALLTSGIAFTLVRATIGFTLTRARNSDDQAVHLLVVGGSPNQPEHTSTISRYPKTPLGKPH